MTPEDPSQQKHSLTYEVEQELNTLNTEQINLIDKALALSDLSKTVPEVVAQESPKACPNPFSKEFIDKIHRKPISK